MKKTRLFLPLLALLLILPLGVNAMTVKAENSVYIPKDQTVDGNLYSAGSTITIDGNVKGDVICAAQSVIISGKIDGDVICAAQNISINGQVGGDLRVAGNSIILNGSVARSGMLFGAFVNMGKQAQIGWDTLIAAGNADLRGKLGGDLSGAGGKMLIGGEVAKNVYLRLDDKKNNPNFNKDQQNLTITKDAKINGNVYYTSSKTAKIEDGAKIKGEVKQNTPKYPERKKRESAEGGWFLVSLFSALIVGLVVISLWKEQILKLTDKMLEKIGPSFGWGAVMLFLTPILFILLLITIIGIPLAFILLGVWLIAIYISKIVAGILIGRSIAGRLKTKQKDSLLFSMIIGIVVLWILCYFPLIGCLFSLFAILWGMGGLWLYFRKA